MILYIDQATAAMLLHVTYTSPQHSIPTASIRFPSPAVSYPSSSLGAAVPVAIPIPPRFPLKPLHQPIAKTPTNGKRGPLRQEPSESPRRDIRKPSYQIECRIKHLTAASQDVVSLPCRLLGQPNKWALRQYASVMSGSTST